MATADPPSTTSNDIKDPQQSPKTTFTLSTSSLKLTTREDIAPHLEPLLPPSSSSPSSSNAPTTTPNAPSITHLDLSGNTLGLPACTYLSTLLPPLSSSLKSASLADIFTGRLLSEIPPAIEALLRGLAQCGALEEVDLSDNAFGVNTVGPVVGFLRGFEGGGAEEGKANGKAKGTGLRRFILQNNGLGPVAGAMVAEALGEMGERQQQRQQKGDAEEPVNHLEVLICGRNRLESGSMAAWSRCFAQGNSHVKEVRMVQNGIRAEGIVELLEQGLGKCTGLEVLDLQDNTFTLTGAQALARVLGNWPSLRELGVGDCLLGARGGVILGEALAKGGNKGLRVLRLQYNEIDGRGVRALVEAVKGGGVPELRRVELNGNKFSEDEPAVEELRELLEGRKEGAEDGEGEGEWGLDELSDLEEESDEEDEDDGSEKEDEEERDEEEEREGQRERVLRDADEAEAQNVAEEQDKDVDALADKLGGTHV